MSFLRFGLVAAVAHAQCVTKQLISAGDGVTFPKAGDTVSMHYTGTLASTGAKFDSSRDRGKEFSTQIGVGQVIQGWDQGVPQMSLGEHAILRISAACGYGARGSPPDIPANADLVFDVELNGLNGRRAGATPAASLAAFSPAPPAFPAPIAKAAPASSLPRCIASNCGHAISFDGTGNTRPLCLCNPICQQMAGTPGVLPCCPGLQEVCLDPYRESPTPAPVRAAVTASANFGSTSAAGSFGLTATTPAAPAALPTCRPNSCGMGMASGVNSMTAVCACDASCLAPNSALPCCQSFREVCQGGSAAASVQQFSQQPAFPQQAAFAPAQQAFAPAQQSFPPAQQAFPLAQQAFPPAQQAFPPAQQAFPPAQQARAPAQQGFAPAQQAFPSAQSNSASCTWGRTQWAEQASCDTKRWAIQNGKCKKSCSAVDAQVNNAIKFWATGTVGKDACAAALAACGF